MMDSKVYVHFQSNIAHILKKTIIGRLRLPLQGTNLGLKVNKLNFDVPPLDLLMWFIFCWSAKNNVYNRGNHLKATDSEVGLIF